MSDLDIRRDVISHRLGSKSDNLLPKDEDLLHSVLSVLLEYNSQYAKGIEELLKSDIDNTEILMALQQKTEIMRTLLEGLSKSQVDLEKLVKILHEDEKTFIKNSLSSVYNYIGVTEDGTPYRPLDGIVVQIKQIITNRIWYLIVGIGIAKLLSIFKLF